MYPLGPCPKLSVLLLGFAAACGDSGGVGAQPPAGGSEQGGAATAGSDCGGGQGGEGGSPETLAWVACALYSEGGDSPEAQCLTKAVPVRWDDPSGPQIDFFVKRFGNTEPARRLWMLNGGPGGPGSDFESVAEYLANLDPDLEVYLPDHRGTGRSSRLGCAAEDDDSEAGFAIEEDEWPTCIASLEASFGEKLDGFRTSEAARDIAAVIDGVGDPEIPVTIFGGSYGTYWAQRYLQLFPEQASAVVLVGITPPTVDFSSYDGPFNEVGEVYLGLCGSDPFCASKLGLDPAAAAHELFQAIDGGQCSAAGFDRKSLRNLFAGLIFYNWEERALVPALLYRLSRCDPADVQALSYLQSVLAVPAEVTLADRLQGNVLGAHIGISELWAATDPTLDELAAPIETAIFSTELGLGLGQKQSYWPRYVPDSYDGVWSEATLPMLMLNGTLDPATPLGPAALVGDNFNGELQRFYEVPGAPHSFVAPYPGGRLCILDAMSSFVADPAQFDDSCLFEIEPLTFQSTTELAMGAFNTPDLYENSQLAPTPDPPSSMRLGLVRESLRRAFVGRRPAATRR